MRIVLASLLASALVGSWAVAAGAGTTPPPRLVLAASDAGQMVISGVRFKSNERVTIRFVALGRAIVKVVRASPKGRVTTRLVGSVPDCEGYSLSAVGSRGSRVFHRQLPPPCGIVLQP